ncbi:MAG TPA: hypothetical protein VKC34_00265, partial [Blastocatellia bacterium]|nr:hypothetical protein [Blastocatellia bacterium]
VARAALAAEVAAPVVEAVVPAAGAARAAPVVERAVQAEAPEVEAAASSLGIRPQNQAID